MKLLGILTAVSEGRFHPDCPTDSSASSRRAATEPASNGRLSRWHIERLFRHDAAFDVAQPISCVCSPALAADCEAERRTWTFCVVNYVCGVGRCIDERWGGEFGESGDLNVSHLVGECKANDSKLVAVVRFCLAWRSANI